MLFNAHIFHFISVVSELSLATVLLHTGFARHTKRDIKHLLDALVLGDDANNKTFNFREFIAYVSQKEQLKIPNVPSVIPCNVGVEYANAITNFIKEYSPSNWYTIATTFIFIATWIFASIELFHAEWMIYISLGLTCLMMIIAYKSFEKWNACNRIITLISEFSNLNSSRPRPL